MNEINSRLIERYDILIRKLESELSALKAENEKYREVLKAYAKDIRTTPDGPLVPNAAKQALSPERREP